MVKYKFTIALLGMVAIAMLLLMQIFLLQMQLARMAGEVRWQSVQIRAHQEWMNEADRLYEEENACYGRSCELDGEVRTSVPILEI